MKKIIRFDRAASLAMRLRSESKVIVTTNGTFDLLHVGHIDSLEQAKSKGDVLIVGVNSDASVRRYKGVSRPIIPVLERVRMVAALECVDYVVVFEEDTPVELLAEIRPAVHCKGSEYADGSRDIPEKILIESYGGKMEFLRLSHDHSTTNIINRILAQK